MSQEEGYHRGKIFNQVSGANGRSGCENGSKIATAGIPLKLCPVGTSKKGLPQAQTRLRTKASAITDIPVRMDADGSGTTVKLPLDSARSSLLVVQFAGSEIRAL